MDEGCVAGAHEVSILIGGAVGTRPRRFSMTIMRRPQQGQGWASACAAIGSIATSQDERAGNLQAMLAKFAAQQLKVGRQITARAEVGVVVTGLLDLVEKALRLPRVVREPDTPRVGSAADRQLH